MVWARGYSGHEAIVGNVLNKYCEEWLKSQKRFIRAQNTMNDNNEIDLVSANQSGPDGMALPRFLYSESAQQSQAPLLPGPEPTSPTVNLAYEMTETMRSGENTITSEVLSNPEVEEGSGSNGVPRTLAQKPSANGREAFDYPVAFPGTLPSTLTRSAATAVTGEWVARGGVVSTQASAGYSMRLSGC